MYCDDCLCLLRRDNEFSTRARDVFFKLLYSGTFVAQMPTFASVLMILASVVHVVKRSRIRVFFRSKKPSLANRQHWNDMDFYWDHDRDYESEESDSDSEGEDSSLDSVGEDDEDDFESESESEASNSNTESGSTEDIDAGDEEEDGSRISSRKRRFSEVEE